MAGCIQRRSFRLVLFCYFWCSSGLSSCPIFFGIFVNDINDVVSSPLFQFADDHIVLRPVHSRRDCVALLNNIHVLHVFHHQVHKRHVVTESSRVGLVFSRHFIFHFLPCRL